MKKIYIRFTQIMFIYNIISCLINALYSWMNIIKGEFLIKIQFISVSGYDLLIEGGARGVMVIVVGNGRD